MARSRRLQGIEVRKNTHGEARYRPTVYVRGERLAGQWTGDPEQAIAWRRRMLAGGGPALGERMMLGRAVETFTAGIKDGSIRNRSGREFKPSVTRGYCRDLAICQRMLGARSKLDEVNLPTAQLLGDQLRRDGLSDSRVRNVMVALRSLYAWAMRRGYATVNPCAGLLLPVGDEQKRERVASLDEAALLIGALSLPERAAFALAVYAGLRAGEVLALAWDAVDLDLRSLRVEQAMDVSTGELQATKTKAGTRVVPIRERLAVILEDHAASNGQTGPLFPATRPRRGAEMRDGARMSYGCITGRMKRAWAGAGLEPLGLHEGRHTFASMLIDAGASAKAICEYMGHSSITITFDRYGHLFPGSEAEVLALLNAYDETGGAR